MKRLQRVAQAIRRTGDDLLGRGLSPAEGCEALAAAAIAAMEESAACSPALDAPLRERQEAALDIAIAALGTLATTANVEGDARFAARALDRVKTLVPEAGR